MQFAKLIGVCVCVQRMDAAAAEEESMRLVAKLMEEEKALMMQRIFTEQNRALQMLHGQISGDLVDGEERGEDGDADLALALRIAAEETATIEEQQDEIDPDEMSYDELLELGEQIGDVKKEKWRVEGREAVSRLEIITYSTSFLSSATKGNANHDAECICVVCQERFQHNENLKLLPCNHHFHVECIDKWLFENKTCPLCQKEII